MNIIDFAKKMGYSLNSMQIILLQKVQEAEENNEYLCVNIPCRSGRTMLLDIIEKYNNL